jgi:hypothetical protein
MADLTKTNLLHRLRIMFDDTGVPTLVETVHKVAIKEGDVVIGHVEELVKTVSPQRLTDAVKAFMVSLEGAKAADAADAAAKAAQVAAEQAAAQAAADAAAKAAAESAAAAAATAAAAAAAAPPPAAPAPAPATGG